MRRLPLRSPPRMRGKVWLHQKPGRVPGITPAYAGKSEAVNGPGIAGKDHPRVCGEKLRCSSFGYFRLGSPPRMRGKDVKFTFDAGKLRITPAYAGKRHTDRRPSGSERDHPRVCGEKCLARRLSRASLGSPPRMRGKATHTRSAGRAAGITPAYAGKSPVLLVLFGFDRDHPRVCGEKKAVHESPATEQGSPPRMRGKGFLHHLFGQEERITPAYAGKRLKRSHSIGHFSCILRLFHSVLHRASASGGSRAGPCAPPCLPAQNAVPV